MLIDNMSIVIHQKMDYVTDSNKGLRYMSKKKIKSEKKSEESEEPKIEKVKMSIRIEPGLKQDWKEYCKKQKIHSNALITKMIEAKMKEEPIVEQEESKND